MASVVDKRRRSAFFCRHCGHQAAQWLGFCPGCRAQDPLVEEPLPDERPRRSPPAATAAPRRLAEVTAGASLRRTTGLAELDRVLGGGLVQGQVVLLGGGPGIGKSRPPLAGWGAAAAPGEGGGEWGGGGG